MTMIAERCFGKYMGFEFNEGNVVNAVIGERFREEPESNRIAWQWVAWEITKKAEDLNALIKFTGRYVYDLYWGKFDPKESGGVEFDDLDAGSLDGWDRVAKDAEEYMTQKYARSN